MELRAPTLSSFWLEEYKNGPIFVSAKIDSNAFIITYSFVIFTTALNYSLVIFFSIKITRTLHSHVINFKDSKIYGKQLHKTLIIQAIGPLLVANVPILSLIAMLFLKVENVVLSLVFSFFLGWIPIVNPLAAMLIITPYRTKIKNIFSKLNATTTTS
uniref:G protein-coupled receptor n=1 Tax=Panagrolaimus davidi TaxID=227884 RepID=A0A914P7E0_9BILA